MDGLRSHLGRLAESGTEWWSAADRNLLEISYSITKTGTPGVKVRRLSNRVTAVIERPVDSFSRTNGSQLARDDARAVVEVVSRRMGLDDGPSL